MSAVPNLFDVFDRVVFINLARRPERLARFNQRMASWPFKPPKRFQAIDGRQVRIPPEWKRGAGAWGCMLSHRTIMAGAIADKVSSLLVLEDDAIPVPDFTARAADFLSRVPDDWDCLMLGAEHIMMPTVVSRGIIRCMGSNRTHAFAVRGRFMATLLHYWEKYNTDHCDIILASLHQYFKVYAPDPFLIGQDAGESDITETTEGIRFLSAEQLEEIAKENPQPPQIV